MGDDYESYLDIVADLALMQNAYEDDPERRVSVDDALELARDAFDFETSIGHAAEVTYVDGENLMYGIDPSASLADLDRVLVRANAVIYHKRVNQVAAGAFSYGVAGCNDVNREMDDVLMLAAAVRRSRFAGSSVRVLSNDGYRWMVMPTDIVFESFPGYDAGGPEPEAAEPEPEAAEPEAAEPEAADGFVAAASRVASAVNAPAAVAVAIAAVAAVVAAGVCYASHSARVIAPATFFFSI